MKSKEIGVQKIQMYCGMIEDRFKALESASRLVHEAMKTQIEKQVKIDLGVYEMIAERDACKERLDELDKQLKKYEGNYNNNGLINQEVERRIQTASPLRKLQNKRKRMTDELKLCGVMEEVRSIFTSADELVAKLTGEMDVDKMLGNLKAINGKVEEATHEL